MNQQEQPKNELEKRLKNKAIASERVALIGRVFQHDYGRRVTKRARSTLCVAMETELNSRGKDKDKDIEHKAGTSTPEEGAEKFAAFAAGSLELEAPEGISPSPTANSLEGYNRVGVAAIKHTIEKAKAYYKKTNVWPVWPFCPVKNRPDDSR